MLHPSHPRLNRASHEKAAVACIDPEFDASRFALIAQSRLEEEQRERICSFFRNHCVCCAIEFQERTGKVLAKEVANEKRRLGKAQSRCQRDAGQAVPESARQPGLGTVLTEQPLKREDSILGTAANALE
jgi:hypothetical protein